MSEKDSTSILSFDQMLKNMVQKVSQQILGQQYQINEKQQNIQKQQNTISSKVNATIQKQIIKKDFSIVQPQQSKNEQKPKPKKKKWVEVKPSNKNQSLGMIQEEQRSEKKNSNINQRNRQNDFKEQESKYSTKRTFKQQNVFNEEMKEYEPQKKTKYRQAPSQNYKSERNPQSNQRQQQERHSNYESKQPKSRNTHKFEHQYSQRDPEYQNKCFKLLKNYTEIDQNQQETQTQLRRLKKLFYTTKLVQSYRGRPQQITLYKSLDYPVLFLGYVYQKEKRYMKIQEIKKTGKCKPHQFHSIVKKISDMHFLPVDICYEEALMKFVNLKAKESKFKIASNKVFFEDDQEFERLFYYCLNQKNVIQFIFFDMNMNDISLGEQYIKQNQKSFPEEFEIFMRFLRSIKTEISELVPIGEEELESDFQSEDDNRTNPQFPKQDVKKYLNTTEKRLDQILNRNLTGLEQELEKKSNQLLQITKPGYEDKNKAIKLEEQIDLLNRNIQSFKQTKQEVQSQIKKAEKKEQNVKLETLMMCLKRMIMAEKHLQSKLPILSKKHQIFERLNKQNLIIIQGQTGSGKSTQLPQILCQYYRLFQDPDSKPVLITQPRRISTRSLAERVADQIQEKQSYFVDYTTSATKTVNPKAKIVFKIDRLVLDELVESPTLQKYSCLVIDEAHQRTISIDVILGLTKQLLKRRKQFKVIVTSASMEIRKFEEYFKTKTLRVSGRLFPVQIQYRPSKQQDTVYKVQNLIQQQLLTVDKHLKDQYKGHILVFCSDTLQIRRLCEIFTQKLNPKLFLVLPLHGNLQTQDQKKAFYKTKQHKLIFASRIAQTAITIDGVKVVIDPGFDREMHYDQQTKFSSMQLIRISQSSAKQRAGRAGRTQQGFCFRLYTEQEFKNRPIDKCPEIKNMALDTLVLRLKSLRIKDIFNFQYIEAPKKEGMRVSLELLKLIGCLDQDEQITKIGQFLIKIPIEPFLARSIIEGLIMQKTIATYPKFRSKMKQYTKPIIQILCLILNANNIFRIPQADRAKGQFIKYEKFSHQKGDFFFLRKIYEQFIFQQQNRNKDSLRNWFQQNYLLGRTLFQIKDQVKQIDKISQNFSIRQEQIENEIQKCKRKLEKYTSEEDLILSCLTTSFCVNICLYSGHPFIGYTYLSEKKTLQIYGTSCLSLLGLNPKWILAYDFYENQKGKLFCRVANQITFDFLKNTIDPYVYDKFKIAEIQKKNPFFIQKNYQLPTMIISKIRQTYQDKFRDSFIKKYNFTFDETNNIVTLFLMYDDKNSAKTEQDSKTIQEYIQNMKTKHRNPYKHNYIGNIFVTLNHGIKIQNINFQSNSTVIQITHMDNEVYQNFANDWQGQGKVEVYGRDKIKIFLQTEEEVKYVEEFIEYLKIKQHKKFDVKKQLVDNRRKIPQTKIYLQWYAGKSQKDNILLMYPYRQNQASSYDGRAQERKIVSSAPQNLTYIEDALAKYEGQKANRQGNRKNRRLLTKSNEFGRPTLTKKGNGINVFNSKFDEIEIYRFLQDLILQGKIDIQFQMPTWIKKFRQPQRPDCQRTDEQWVEQIKDLISSLTKNNQNCIRVWGYRYKPFGKQKTQLSNLQKNYRIQMNAEIRTFDLKLLNKMKAQYQGQKYILGCQKMHVSSMFQQCIAVVQPKVFNNLYDEYIYNVQNFREQYLTIAFNHYQLRTKRNNGTFKYKIVAKSQNRQDLLQPIRILGDLFTPRYIVVEDRQFRYLDGVENGQKILDWIQEEYQYKIYFAFDRYRRKIKLYCHESLAKKVQQRLRQQLRRNKSYTDLISYRGKNLKRIEQLLKKKQQQLRISKDQSKNLFFEILFTHRKIFVSGDFETLEWAKKQIFNIKQNVQSNECTICNDIMTLPYQLFNCNHKFCCFCLASVARQFKHLPNQLYLKCPYYDDKKDTICGKEINIHDVAVILSQQQLQKICDLKISKFVEQNKDKYLQCLSPNCQQIFLRQMIEKQDYIDCSLCGKNYCLVCEKSHKNYTCDEWKDKDNFKDDSMKKLGIKRCPKCRRAIEKDGGCNHIHCRCGAHICWKCLKYFDFSNDCYDHLAKACGGIFDPGAE